jgi:hypothetical protein
MKESKRLNSVRPPTGRMRSVSGQAAEQTDATTDLTTSERPLHEYVAAVLTAAKRRRELKAIRQLLAK